MYFDIQHSDKMRETPRGNYELFNSSVNSVSDERDQMRQNFKFSN